jgi:hypothetical protein
MTRYLFEARAHFGKPEYSFSYQGIAPDQATFCDQTRAEWSGIHLSKVKCLGLAAPYLSGFPEVLAQYKCEECDAAGVKLWRLPHHASGLKCNQCIGVDVDAGGRAPLEPIGDISFHGQQCDQIKGWLPAVPTESHDFGFWGYSTVPIRGVDWWKKLPARKKVLDSFLGT